MTVETELDEAAERDAAGVLALVDELFATADTNDAQAFLERQFDLGLSRVHFPVGEGGIGANPKLQAIVDRAIAERHGPVVNSMSGPNMCAPTIVAHGTEEQKRRWLRPLFSGEQIWCQLFSEPGAGSDLAGLATSAVRDGDSWIVNGQKIWSSNAHRSRWGLLLARTNPDVPKHEGITVFGLDLTSPGVEVRPLRQMNGEAHFNEEFLTDVVIPDTDRIGEVGDGWRVTLTTLMNERVAIGSGTGRQSHGPLHSTLELWKAKAEHDPVQREQLAGLWVEAEVGRLNIQRSVAARKRGTPGPEGAISKLYGAILGKKTAQLTIALAGAEGLLHPGYALNDDRSGSPSAQLVGSASLEIGGGTSEIMRNVIAERTLGLPGDVRVDRGVPWRDVPRG
jgi:alkylation response protein AidB-like acyl-CoA dehydrogenase